MKRTELLNSMRPSKARKAVELALRPEGVTVVEMVAELGMAHNNRLRALHVQGLATLVRQRAANGHLAYCLLSDESLNAWGLQNQKLRAEAYQRMQAMAEADYADRCWHAEVVAYHHSALGDDD